MAFKPLVVIAGGSGFLGHSLVQNLSNKYQFIIISRNPDKVTFAKAIRWTKSPDKLSPYLEQAEALINLSGKSVNCRYNEKNKNEIIASRVQSTDFLAEALKSCTTPPKVWINMSSATIYPHSFTPHTEQHVIQPKGFSEEVCSLWEKAFINAETGFIRKVIIRTSLVMGKEGGALSEYIQLGRRYLAGKIGDGNRMVSWIHEKDFCSAIDFIIQGRAMGIYNLTSPFPIKQVEFINLLRKRLGVNWGLAQNELMVKMGAFLLGTEAELALKSRYVLPQRLLNAGFTFQFERMNETLKDLIQLQSAEKESRSSSTGNFALPSLSSE